MSTTIQSGSVNEPGVESLGQRYHFMDNLRAMAMLIGIVFHVALAYSPYTHNLWFVADTEKSIALDFFVSFSHLFRMPLFFLISGFFALMLLERRGIADFLKNRGKRILLPFVIFLPLSLAAIFASITWGVSFVENIPPILTLMSDAKSGEVPPSSAHLWFLFNLLGFCLLAALFYKIKMLQGRLLNILVSPFFLLVLLPLIIIPALYTQPAPFPAPDKFHPEIWSYGFYGIFFLVGCAFYQNRSAIEQLEKYHHLLLVIGVTASVIFYNVIDDISTEYIQAVMAGTSIEPSGSTHLINVAIQAVGVVYLALYCLLLGKKFFNQSNEFMRYIADSSYWLYIVHIPLLLVIQFPLIDLNLNVWLKFSISLLAVFAIGLASYALFVRGSFIGKLLNGKKKNFS